MRSLDGMQQRNSFWCTNALEVQWANAAAAPAAAATASLTSCCSACHLRIKVETLRTTPAVWPVGTPAVPALPCYGAQLGQAAVKNLIRHQLQAVSGCKLTRLAWHWWSVLACWYLNNLYKPAVPILGFQLVANHCALSCKLTGPAVLGAAQLFFFFFGSI
jgi:hypothetical protein